MTVADAKPALFGTVDEEEPTEGPERLPTDIRGVFLIHDQDATSALDQFARHDEPGQPGAHHDHVSVSHDATLSASQAASVSAG